MSVTTLDKDSKRFCTRVQVSQSVGRVTQPRIMSKCKARLSVGGDGKIVALRHPLKMSIAAFRESL